MDITPFLRRWLPKQVAAITTSPQPFRSKLIPDDDAAELELGALQTCSSNHELRDIARHASAVSTASSGHDAAVKALPAWQTDSSSIATASKHDVDHPLADAEQLQTISPSYDEASLQHWQESAADIRLVLGVLLDSSGSCSKCRQFVQQLSASHNWKEACQQHTGTLILR
jgi:hypothetical protein